MPLLQEVRRKAATLLEGIVLIPHFLRASRLRRSRVAHYEQVSGSLDNPDEPYWRVAINTCQHPFVSWLYVLIAPTGSTKPIWLDRRYPNVVSRVFTGSGHYWYEIKHGRAYGSGTWEPVINMLLLKQLIDEARNSGLTLDQGGMALAPADQ